MSVSSTIRCTPLCPESCWNELFEYLRLFEYRWTQRIFSAVQIVAASAHFIFSAICTETLQRRTLLLARWPPDRHRRNDSNRPTNLGCSYRLPLLLKAALFLLFWLIKKRGVTTHQYLFSRTPLHRLVSLANSDCQLWYRLKLNFPFFYNARRVIPRISKAFR